MRRLPFALCAIVLVLVFCVAAVVPAETNEWTYSAINLPADQPSELPEGSLPVRIALIDTGIKTDGLDASQIETGVNYAFPDKTTVDLVGHGTRIAGLILGASDGTEALRGIAPNSVLVPLVYYSQYASGVPQNGGVAAICQAIYDAVDSLECRVIGISSGITAPDEALWKAITYAEEKGVIVVSAVGNDNITAPDRVYYPAAYDTVIGVGAVNRELERYRVSQVGPGITACAPGEDIVSVSIKGGTYLERISGTSYATAYVTGMAALLLEAHPDMTPAQFRWVVQNTGVDLGEPSYDLEYGFGLIDVSTALRSYEELAASFLPFSDVSISDPFFNTVKMIYERGVMGGISPTKFAPDAPVTRAMAVTVLHRLAGLPGAGFASVQTNLFTDVPDGEWFSDAVAWAASAGIVSGMGDGTFAPHSSVTWEQMAVILRNYVLNIPDFRDSGSAGPSGSSIFSRFVDGSTVSPWAIEAMAWAVNAGLIDDGGDGALDPLGSPSRAEVAAMLYRFLQR